jgi:16S rRNA (adenine1518-N6/adenine1519-N6)-dimethyltransferase
VQTLTEIRQLLAERGLTPRHRLGQNFLHDKNQLTKLVDAANVQPSDLILEVGPGTGTLTEALLERGANMIACELDEQLANLLHDRLDDRITLIRGDALDKQRRLNPQIIEAIHSRRFKLVANLPYQIASPLISSLLTDHPNCRGMYVTIQKEVAERLMAQSNSKAYGSLTIIVQALADIELISTLSPGCFWPPPDVTSAMIAITPKHSTPIKSGTESARAFATFITQMFTKRRKQLGTVFGRQHAGWSDERVQSLVNLRPDAISVDQAIALWQVFAQE